MSKPLGVNETLDQLGRLAATVRDLVVRGGELDGQFRARLAKEQQRHAVDSRKLEEQITAEVAETETRALSTKTALEARHAVRLARIRRAQSNSASVALHHIERGEGQQRYEIQRDLLQVARNRDSARAEAEQLLGEFRAALAEVQQAQAAVTARARQAFRGYNSCLNVPAPSVPPVAAADADEHKLLATFREAVARAEGELAGAAGAPLTKLFSIVPLPVLLLLLAVAVGGVAVAGIFGITKPVPYLVLGGAFGGAAVLVVILYFAGRSGATRAGSGVSATLGKLHQTHAAAAQAAEARFKQRVEKAEVTHAKRTEELQTHWGTLANDTPEMREAARRATEEKAARLIQHCEQWHRKRVEHAAAAGTAAVTAMQSSIATRRRQLADAQVARQAQLAAEHQTARQSLDADWSGKVVPMYQSLAAAGPVADRVFPAWSSALVDQWRAPEQFAHAAKVGLVEVDLEKLAGVSLAESSQALPGPAKFPVPLALALPRGGSILLETNKGGRDEAIGTLNNILLRLLATAPVGRLNFTIIDPVGLGQSFAGITHLADFGETILNGRIWTQAGQIEQRLAELNEHMEKVIQMYLRNEYETITEYNEKAGSIAEKYHFLVIADFPVNFSETAMKRLLSIAASGARCGVFTLIHWDRRQNLQHEIVLDDLRKSSVTLTCKEREFTFTNRPGDGLRIQLESPPDAAAVTGFIQKVGEASINSNRVEVPFAQIAPEEAEFWSLATTNELRVPIGRTGATKLQYLALGQGTRQHGLIAGKTGSGKSTLFHVIITNLAAWCSPEQVEFYLVDFKKGVEFQCYAEHRLPHARVIAIESDREFGLSVLQRLDDELRRRGEMFRKLGVQDLAGYKAAGGTEAVPRALLVIDEFQEFFTEDDRISQSAALLLDRIVRQGRAFGIHVLLGSQTLGGAYTLARTTIGQMVIRVALQCNEADAYLIMDENNPAPRLLSRPGEGIYNDQAGAIEGNSPFQTVWLPDAVREQWLEKVRVRSEQSGQRRVAPVIFEGNAPADVRENDLLRAALQSRPAKAPLAPRVWFGAPNSIKGPTEAVFHRQSGNNLLIIGQRDEAALSLLTVAVVSLAAQCPKDTARFVVFDSSAPGAPERDYLDQLARSVPHGLTVARGADIEAELNRLAAEMKERVELPEAAGRPAVFVFVHGLQRFKKLRFEEDFSFSGGDAPNPGKQFNDLLAEGPSHGIHVIAVCDTLNNLNRMLNRKAIGEFEMRVLFQMSANDSAALIDSPRAGNLGLHRAVFYNEQEGYLEVFRPYALPGAEWLEKVRRSA